MKTSCTKETKSPVESSCLPARAVRVRFLVALSPREKKLFPFSKENTNTRTSPKDTLICLEYVLNFYEIVFLDLVTRWLLLCARIPVKVLRRFIASNYKRSATFSEMHSKTFSSHGNVSESRVINEHKAYADDTTKSGLVTKTLLAFPLSLL